MNDDQPEPKDGDAAIYSAGALHDQGLRPLFGRWRATYPFYPASYNNHAALEPFFALVRAGHGAKFLFTGEVSVTITLYGDERKLIESGRYGDVDNYAKAICDGLKGRDGVMLDDSQMQALAISWIDSSDEYFEVEVAGLEGETALKEGLELFEMPNGLYYAVPAHQLSDDGLVEPLPDGARDATIRALAQTISAAIALSQKTLTLGATEKRAYELSQMAMPIDAFEPCAAVRRAHAHVRGVDESLLPLAPAPRSEIRKVTSRGCKVVLFLGGRAICP